MTRVTIYILKWKFHFFLIYSLTKEINNLVKIAFFDKGRKLMYCHGFVFFMDGESTTGQ